MIFDLDNNIFGLDISDLALRLIQLKKNGKKIMLSAYNETAVAPGIIVNGEIKQEDKLISLLARLIKTAKGKRLTAKNVITVLPESKTFIKVIDLNVPTGNQEKLAGAVTEEIKNHIPLATDEIYLDWQVLEKNNETSKVLIGAAPKNIVDTYLAVLEKTGLTPLVFEIEAQAVVRALLTKTESLSNTAKIIIDFGAVRTGLIVYDQQAIPFTVSLPISGENITETIAQTLKLTREQAEKAKIVCGLDPQKCEGVLLKILLKNVENLVSQIKKAMVFYKTNFPASQAVTEIVVCGGGANFSHINQVLSERLNIKVTTGNPLVNLIGSKKINLPQNKVLTFTTAIGLALRAVEEKRNLL